MNSPDRTQETEPRLPSLIVVGAMKSGTSSLYHYLGSNPALSPARLKEVDFFRSDDDVRRGLDWYSELFAGGGGLAYDVSPNYTKRHIFPGVASRIARVLPDVRIVYVIREPIARTVSHFVHSTASGSERRSFAEAIRSDGSNYVQTSRYSYQMQDYLDHFQRDQILLLQSEELRRDPLASVRSICEFAGFPASFDATVLERRFHETTDKRRASAVERAGRRWIQNRHVRSTIRRVGAPIVTRLQGRSAAVEKPELTDSDVSYLRSIFSEDVAALRRDFDVALAEWDV